MFLIILDTPSISNLNKKTANVSGQNLNQKHLTFSCEYDWMKHKLTNKLFNAQNNIFHKIIL